MWSPLAGCVGGPSIHAGSHQLPRTRVAGLWVAPPVGRAAVAHLALRVAGASQRDAIGSNCAGCTAGAGLCGPAVPGVA